jgi:hypothetical protein
MAPVIPTGEETYNKIMSGINPSLTTGALKNRDKTKELTEAERRKIDADFAEYQKQFSAYSTRMQSQVRNYHRFALHMSESLDRSGESDTLKHLTSDIAHSK